MNESRSPHGGAPGDTPFEAWLRSVFQDSLMWPVLAVGLLCTASFGAVVITAAVQDRNVGAMGIIAGFAGVSLYALDGDIRRRRLGPSGQLLLGTWLLTAIVAVGFIQLIPR